jgi:PTS system ascorbate-specific IIB component
MVKILVACGAGMGSSTLIKQNVETVLRKYEVKAEIYQTSVDEAGSLCHEYDFIVVSHILAKRFEEKAGNKVIPLKNLLSKKEMADKFREKGIIE